MKNPPPKGSGFLGESDPTGTRTPNRLLRRQMLYPVELWDQTGRHSSQGTKMCRFFLHPMFEHKKRESGAPPLNAVKAANQLFLERPTILSPASFFFFFLDFLPVSADAPLEQHPAEAALLQEASLVSVDAEAPLEQQPADLDLSHDAFPSVEAEAPLAQHPADLDLSQLAFLPSLEQVCSVLAFLSAGASVD